MPTIFDRLEEKKISWKFYVQNYEPKLNYRTVDQFPGNRGSQVIWVPLLMMDRFIDNPELSKHIVDLSEYYTDLQNGTLPAVAFIAPSGPSEHPPSSLQSGQRFVRGLIQALMRSDAWTSSAFLVAYDDWGGWYDHVPPPRVDEYGYGFRVPAFLVSPYAKKGYIDNTQLDYTSVLKFIQENHGLQPLAARDAKANSFAERLRLLAAAAARGIHPLGPAGSQTAVSPAEYHQPGLRCGRRPDGRAGARRRGQRGCARARPRVSGSTAPQERGRQMNRSVLRRLLVPSRIAGALALVFALALLSPVAVAAQADARPTHIIIEPSQPVVVGQPVTLSVRLATTSGEAVGALANEVLELWINDQPDRRIRTDANGAAQIRVSTDLTVGPHRVRVIYRGSSALAGSEAGTELVILPAHLAVQTVPPIANVTFSLGGRQFTSGADGVADIEVDVPGSYELKVVSTDVKTSDTHATFSRWADDEFTETRQVILPNDELLQAGFDVSYRISWSYIDLDGEPVDPSRASVMTVKGTHGATQVFKKYEPQWLLGTRVVRLQGGLQEAKIQWGVENVIVDGANTVNRGQHRFYVKPGDRWPIQLLLYTADFAAADALFGFPVGSGFKLQYPDGEVRYFPSGTRQEDHRGCAGARPVHGERRRRARLCAGRARCGDPPPGRPVEGHHVLRPGRGGIHLGLDRPGLAVRRPPASHFLGARRRCGGGTATGRRSGRPPCSC